MRFRSSLMIQRLSLITALFWAVPAGAEPQTLGVGLFTPELGYTPYELFDEVDRIARHLSADIGTPVAGHSYKVRRDLVADIRARKIQFAIIGGFSLGSTSGIVRVLAVGGSASANGHKWTLMAKRTTPIPGIKGQTLQLPSVSPNVVDYVEHGLMGSNISLHKFFKIAKSPGLFSAVEAVRVGAAAVVLAPINTKGLMPLLSKPLVVPPPGLVLVTQSLPESVVQAVKRAMLSYQGKGNLLPRFVPGDRSAYRRFSAKRKRHRLAMMPTPPDALKLDSKALLVQRDIDLELPSLEINGLFQTPRMR